MPVKAKPKTPAKPHLSQKLRAEIKSAVKEISTDPPILPEGFMASQPSEKNLQPGPIEPEIIRVPAAEWTEPATDSRPVKLLFEGPLRVLDATNWAFDILVIAGLAYAYLVVGPDATGLKAVPLIIVLGPAEVIFGVILVVDLLVLISAVIAANSLRPLKRVYGIMLFAVIAVVYALNLIITGYNG